MTVQLLSDAEIAAIQERAMTQRPSSFDVLTLLSHIRAMTAENFALAAGQCIVDGGLIGHENGSQICTLASRLAAAEQRATNDAEIDGLRQAELDRLIEVERTLTAQRDALAAANDALLGAAYAICCVHLKETFDQPPADWALMVGASWQPYNAGGAVPQDAYMNAWETLWRAAHPTLPAPPAANGKDVK